MKHIDRFLLWLVIATTGLIVLAAVCGHIVVVISKVMMLLTLLAFLILFVYRFCRYRKAVRDTST